MTICQQCHHHPSGREEGIAPCYCQCHAAADAAPLLLAACQYVDSCAPDFSGDEAEDDVIQINVTAEGLRKLRAALAAAGGL